MIYAVIAAGGVGSRMGDVKPKQFIEINNKPIILYTVEKFLKCEKIDKIIVLCPCEWVEYTKSILPSFVEVLQAGKDRNETLLKAISFVESNYGIDDTYFVTHDAVRPFVSEEIINNNIEKMLQFNITGTFIPATDTIAESINGNTVDKIPNRSILYQAQTPQCFPAKLFKETYNSLTEAEKETLTDACKIFVLKGYKVQIVKGDASNIKITYPFDLTLAKAILESK